MALFVGVRRQVLADAGALAPGCLLHSLDPCLGALSQLVIRIGIDGIDLAPAGVALLPAFISLEVVVLFVLHQLVLFLEL